MALRMRQSLAQLEDQFNEDMQRDRHRSETLRRHAISRTRKRTIERRKKRSSLRFWVLVMSLVMTAVAVTVGMFATLYYLLT
jgi:anti-sigma-K factor RskA